MEYYVGDALIYSSKDEVGLWKNSLFLFLNKFETMSYCKHFSGYFVRETTDFMIIKIENLNYIYPLDIYDQIHMYSFLKIIILKYPFE